MTSYRRVLIQALTESGDLIRTHIAKPKAVRHKGEIDLLTKTDERVERLITRLIKKNFPDHVVLAEEFSNKNQDAEFKWIIDPIDGTTNFVHSFPQVATSIALEHKGTIILGGIHDPIRQELFIAEKGKGAFCNGKRIHVSRVARLSDALLVTGFPYDRRKHIDFYLSFYKAFKLKCHGIRRMGAAALDFCYIACGRLDGYWEFKLKPWDVAAGSLIVEEAGGSVTDFSGKPFSIYGTETLATNAHIHTEMRRIIQKTM